MKLQACELSTLIEESTLRVVSEYNLFELVLKWINFDRAVREEHTALLMESVRLPLLTGEQLVEMVSHPSRQNTTVHVSMVKLS